LLHPLLEIGTDEQVLIEHLTHRTNEEMAAIVAAYLKVRAVPLALLLLTPAAPSPAATARPCRQLEPPPQPKTKTPLPAHAQMFGKTLERDLKGDLSGHMEALFVALARGKRMDSGNVTADVDHLYRAGEGRMGTDEKVFVDILAGSSEGYLEQLAVGYARAHGHTVAKALDKEIGGWLGKALQALGECWPGWGGKGEKGGGRCAGCSRCHARRRRRCRWAGAAAPGGQRPHRGARRACRAPCSALLPRLDRRPAPCFAPGPSCAQ
jgi:hypothetical protein